MLLSVLVLFIIILLGLYQGFVDDTHAPLTLKNLTSQQFWQAFLSRTWSRDPEFLSCGDTLHSAIYADTQLITTTCANGCQFTLKEIDGKTSTIPVITERSMDFDTKVTAVELLGADITKGTLVYLVPEYKRIYYVDITNREKPRMWHEIMLAPNETDKLEYVSIKRAKDGKDYIVLSNQDRGQLYLYSLDSLWLRIIKLQNTTNLSLLKTNDTRFCLNNN